MFQLVDQFPNGSKISTTELDLKQNMCKYETAIFYSDGSSTVLKQFNDELSAKAYHKAVLESNLYSWYR